MMFPIFNCFFFFLTYLMRTFRCRVSLFLLYGTMRYTVEEYTDMIYCYGVARGNARAAERVYAELFPHRDRHPSYATIMHCFRRARRTGILQPTQYERPVRRENVDEDILRAFEQNPHNSIRRVARALGTSRWMVHQVLRENGLRPFHYQRVQHLLARDEVQRVYFCGGIFISLF